MTNAKKMKNNGNKFLTGFTIIELIVVIAIIAVLASIVMINVVGYIAKAKDAAIKSNLGTIQTTATTYFLKNGNYTGLSGDISASASASAIDNAGGAAVIIASTSGAGYCASSTLVADKTKSWCVDGTGFNGNGACSDGICGADTGGTGTPPPTGGGTGLTNGTSCSHNSDCASGTCYNLTCEASSFTSPAGSCQPANNSACSAFTDYNSCMFASDSHGNHISCIPQCSGTPASCDSYSYNQSGCQNAGCNWIQTLCSGSPTNCSNIGRMDYCQNAGCNWGWDDSVSNYDCSGTPSASCNNITDSGECNGIGCNFQSNVCNGTPASCGAMSSSNCTGGCAFSCTGSASGQNCSSYAPQNGYDGLNGDPTPEQACNTYGGGQCVWVPQ